MEQIHSRTVVHCLTGSATVKTALLSILRLLYAQLNLNDTNLDLTMKAAQRGSSGSPSAFSLTGAFANDEYLQMIHPRPSEMKIIFILE